MKIFAVRDENDAKNKNLAYLFYYEREKLFFIELPDDADPWETPLLLDSFAKRRIRTVNAYWSKLWVQQRIVPPDRQNLGQILKENGLDTYDEYELLMLSKGRCAQDDYYLVPLSQQDLPEAFTQRYAYKVEDVIPLENRNLLVFFRDSRIKKCSLFSLAEKEKAFAPILKREELFRAVSVQTGGYGICWGENLVISDKKLYESGETIPLSLTDFSDFARMRIVNVAEAAELLECSRQNVNDLIRRGKLHPVKSDARNTMLLKSEILQRKWR